MVRLNLLYNKIEVFSYFSMAGCSRKTRMILRTTDGNASVYYLITILQYIYYFHWISPKWQVDNMSTFSCVQSTKQTYGVTKVSKYKSHYNKNKSSSFFYQSFLHVLYVRFVCPPTYVKHVYTYSVAFSFSFCNLST